MTGVYITRAGLSTRAHNGEVAVNPVNASKQRKKDGLEGRRVFSMGGYLCSRGKGKKYYFCWGLGDPHAITIRTVD